MKIKGLLLGMFACAALVACTNDDLVENDGNQPQTGELENIPAYITVSLSGSSNSSRAAVNGDTDGDSEDSGHHNAGLPAENNVNNVLVVIKSVDELGAKVDNSGIAEVISKDDFTKGGTDNEPIYTVTKKFKVLAGEHKVLVIVNPIQKIQDAIPVSTNYEAIGKFYDDLLKSDLVKDYSGTLDNVASKTGAGSFMMANREEISVKATSANTTDAPKVANIFVERVVSKITFRNTSIKGEEKANLYPIEFGVTFKGYKLVEDEADTPNKYIVSTDAKGAFVAVKVETATPVEYEKGKNYIKEIKYTESLEVHAWDATNGVGVKLDEFVMDKGTTIPGDNIYYVVKEGDKPLPVFETYTTTVSDWKVQLTEYALVNLNRNLFTVRHTASALGENIAPFGYLDGQNYIADPWFEAKNAANTVETDDNKFDGSTWFTNTLAEVAKETAGTVPTTSFFNSLDKLSDDDNGTDYEGTTEEHSKPGLTMAYCFENTTLATKQKHGLTTGIVFKATMVPSGTQMFTGTMYQYGKEVYTKLEEIVKAYGPTNAEIAKLTTESTNAEIRKAGIKVYAKGECYYYTNQIKHFDNGDNTVAGNMEFAIVRNNIYSLAVANIRSIGDAAIDPNPDTDNESAVGYIQIEAKILPWIVRYNNIEF